MSLLVRVRAAVTVLVLLALTLATAAVSAVLAPAASATTISRAHPYSEPVWFPIRNTTYLDCVLSNPGCVGGHGAWTMDMVLETLDGSHVTNPGVYAMGAGILYVGNAHGSACTEDGGGNFGTWVWIDHGGGVVSRYGHLSAIAVRSGSYVAAGQRIGTMGTTGKGSNCTVPYVDFQVHHHGLSGPLMPMRTLRVCASRTAVGTWPTDLHASVHIRPRPEFASIATRYTDFNLVPQRSVDFPATATTGACIPTTRPATPEMPARVHVRAVGGGRITVSWAAGSRHVGSVQVELSQYHSSTRHWDHPQYEHYVTLRPGSRSYTFSRLYRGHHYRATVQFHNAAGFGLGVRPASVVVR